MKNCCCRGSCPLLVVVATLNLCRLLWLHRFFFFFLSAPGSAPSINDCLLDTRWYPSFQTPARHLFRRNESVSETSATAYRSDFHRLQSAVRKSVYGCSCLVSHHQTLNSLFPRVVAPLVVR